MAGSDCINVARRMAWLMSYDVVILITNTLYTRGGPMRVTYIAPNCLLPAPAAGHRP
jgi:hypothetical protein